MFHVQQWFNLSDLGVEEALYESAALRRFVGVDLGVAPAPDETTVCRFRHLLEKHDLGGLILEAVNVHLVARGIRSSPRQPTKSSVKSPPASDQAPAQRLFKATPLQLSLAEPGTFQRTRMSTAGEPKQSRSGRACLRSSEG